MAGSNQTKRRPGSSGGAGGGGGGAVSSVNGQTGTVITPSYTDHGNTGAAEDIALVAGVSVHRLVLNAASVAITFSGATNGVYSKAVLILVQDATGGRVCTWPAAVKWPNGLAPTLTVTASGRDRLEIETEDGATTIDGIVRGVAFG